MVVNILFADSALHTWCYFPNPSPPSKMKHPSKLLFTSLPSPLKQILSSHVVCTFLTTILCLACYWNSLGGELVHDDIFAIKDNQDLHPTTPLFDLFKNDFWGEPMSSVTSHKSYRPLTVLTFRLNYWLHGLSPWGYHVINVVLHVISTSLFGVLCRLVVFKGYSDLSFLATWIFAAHSVHTEAVSAIEHEWCGLDTHTCMHTHIHMALHRSQE